MDLLSIDIPSNKRPLKLPFWLIKILRFEFWPYWILYIPIFFYYVWLSIKARSFSFFTATNPGIYLGGFVGESKTSILKKIAPEFLPATLYFNSYDCTKKVLEELGNSAISYPFIIKPDVGERGNGVEKISNEKALLDYLANFQGDFIIQEFVTYELELGVLFYHTPDGKESGITSVVIKEFLSVKGNGMSTLSELIHQSERAQLRIQYLLEKHKSNLNDIVKEGQEILLEPIGNHCRGTKFINGNSLINESLVNVFRNISVPIEGFYIGRYDLKAKSIDDLYAGKNISIMELNGVTSEPAHIYDPQETIFEAYRALFQHYHTVYRIAVQNNKKGVAYVPFSFLYKQIRMHLKGNNK